jgi:hypothetical protein
MARKEVMHLGTKNFLLSIYNYPEKRGFCPGKANKILRILGTQLAYGPHVLP